MTSRSFLPTHAEIAALERDVADADPCVEPAELRKIDAYRESLRRHGRKLRYIPLLGSFYVLLSIFELPAPWWSSLIAAVAFGGAGWLWGERLGLVFYRHLLERQLLPSRTSHRLAASSSSEPVAVRALTDGVLDEPQDDPGPHEQATVEPGAR